MNISIEKFMKTMGITYDIERGYTFHTHGTGRPGVCYAVYAYYEGKKTYDQHHCYSIKKDGVIIYEEGNEVIGLDQGVFSYLGMNADVRRYFEVKTRKMAQEFLVKFI
jgi:hypothetical protein